MRQGGQAQAQAVAAAAAGVSKLNGIQLTSLFLILNFTHHTLNESALLDQTNQIKQSGTKQDQPVQIDVEAGDHTGMHKPYNTEDGLILNPLQYQLKDRTLDVHINFCYNIHLWMNFGCALFRNFWKPLSRVFGRIFMIAPRGWFAPNIFPLINHHFAEFIDYTGRRNDSD